ENNIPFDLLHGLQYQQLWLGLRPPHNIKAFAHNPNTANSSSPHRTCARTHNSVAGQVCPFCHARSSTPTTRSGTAPVSTSTRLMALRIVSSLTGIPNQGYQSPPRPLAHSVTNQSHHLAQTVGSACPRRGQLRYALVKYFARTSVIA